MFTSNNTASQPGIPLENFHEYASVDQDDANLEDHRLDRMNSDGDKPPPSQRHSILTEHETSQHEGHEPSDSLVPSLDQSPSCINRVDSNNNLTSPSGSRPGTLEMLLPSKSLWKRLSWTCFAILVPGSLAMLGIIVFLSLLWNEAMAAAAGGLPKSPWAALLNVSRASTAVTLCTAALRIIIVSQASLTTAMIASIALEDTGVPFLHAPTYSFVRALNSGPTSLLPTLWSWPRGVGSIVIYTLITLQLAVIAASQLLSTVLLLDISARDLTNVSQNVTAPTMLSSNGPGFPDPFAGYTFAERPGTFIKGLGFEDTGDTYRAFIPLDNATDRTALRRYEGVAGVVNQRVVCFQPRLTNLRFATTGAQIPEENILRGNVELNEGMAKALFNKPQPRTYSLGCALPQSAFHGDNTTSRVICNHPTLKLDVPPVHPHNFTSLSERYQSLPFIIVIDTFAPGRGPTFKSRKNPIAMSLEQDHDVVGREHPWATVSRFPGVKGASPSMNISACFSDEEIILFDTQMERHSGGFETSISYDRREGRWDTEDARRQLGASRSPGSLQDRGLLELLSWTRIDNLPPLEELPWDPDSFSGFPMGGSIEDAIGEHGDERFVQIAARLDTDLSLHRTQSQIYMDTVRETESVVLGLQALLAMSSQQRFYISLTEATYNYTAVASFARPALVPERWLGVILAGSLVAVQISLACAIAAYFLARTRMSAVDNAWQTLAQMVSHSTMDMLEQADTMTDDEVKALAREQLGKETAAGHGLLRYRGGRVGFEPL